jgi:hypothetical protein
MLEIHCQSHPTATQQFWYPYVGLPNNRQPIYDADNDRVIEEHAFLSCLCGSEFLKLATQVLTDFLSCLCGSELDR